MTFLKCQSLYKWELHFFFFFTIKHSCFLPCDQHDLSSVCQMAVCVEEKENKKLGTWVTIAEAQFSWQQFIQKSPFLFTPRQGRRCCDNKSILKSLWLHMKSLFTAHTEMETGRYSSSSMTQQHSLSTAKDVTFKVAAIQEERAIKSHQLLMASAKKLHVSLLLPIAWIKLVA